MGEKKLKKNWTPLWHVSPDTNLMSQKKKTPDTILLTGIKMARQFYLNTDSDINITFKSNFRGWSSSSRRELKHL